jgi:hypothetical protein
MEPAKASGDRILTTAEAAKMLGVQPVRIRQFCEEHRFHSARQVKLNERWVVLESDVRAFALVPRPTGRRPTRMRAGR